MHDSASSLQPLISLLHERAAFSTVSTMKRTQPDALMRGFQEPQSRLDKRSKSLN